VLCEKAKALLISAVELRNKALTLMEADRGKWREYATVALNKLNEAMNCLDMSVSKDPANPDAWEGKGTLLLFKDQPQEAIVCFDRALKYLDYCPDSDSACNVRKEREKALQRLK
jgi:tetratricopeptide (TPR) repeat protein